MAQCCKYNIGQMKTLAIIERKVRTPDSMGGFLETWSPDPVGGIWCSVRMLTGTVRWEAERSVPGNLMRLVTRFRPDSSGGPYWSAATDRVVIRGRIYAIMAVVDVDLAQKWISMDIFESKAS